MLEGVFQQCQMSEMRRAEATFVDQYAIQLPFEQDWCLEISFGKRVKGGGIAWVS